jgi:hypothetical protein
VINACTGTTDCSTSTKGGGPGAGDAQGSTVAICKLRVGGPTSSRLFVRRIDRPGTLSGYVLGLAVAVAAIAVAVAAAIAVAVVAGCMVELGLELRLMLST